MGGRGYGGGWRGRVSTYRYTVTTRMTCIKMGSHESHFNVSLVVRDKVTRQCPQTTTFLKRKESQSGIKPRSFHLPAYRLNARPNWLLREKRNVLSLLLKEERVSGVPDVLEEIVPGTFRNWGFNICGPQCVWSIVNVCGPWLVWPIVNICGPHACVDHC